MAFARPVRATRRLAFCLALLAVVRARVFSGVASAASGSVTIAQFVFDHASGVAGFADIAAQTSDANDALLGFDEAAWSQLAGQPCAAAFANARLTYPLPVNTSFAHIAVPGSSTPQLWTFIIAQSPLCAGSIDVSFTLTLTQADGAQLSADERGLPSVYTAVSVVHALGAAGLLAAHVRARFLPVLSLLLLLTLGIGVTAMCVYAAYWRAVATDGLTHTHVIDAADALRSIGLLMSWLLAAPAASGFGITHPHAVTSGRAWIVPVTLLVLLSLASVANVAYVAIEDASLPGDNASLDWAAIMLLVCSCVYACWYLARARHTVMSEREPAKRAFLQKLVIVVGSQFCIIPALVVVSVSAPLSERRRDVAVVLLSLLTAYLAASAWVLWPSACVSMFQRATVSELLLEWRSRASTAASGTPSDYEDLTMNDAYAQSAEW